MQRKANEAVENVPFPSIAVDNNYNIVACNNLAIKLLHSTLSDISQTSLFDFFYPIDSALTHLGSIKKIERHHHIFVINNQTNPSQSIKLTLPQVVDEDFNLILVSEEVNWEKKYKQKETYLKRLFNAVEGTNIAIWEFNILNGKATLSDKFKKIIHEKVTDPVSWDDFKSAIYEEDRLIFDSFLKSHIESNLPLNFEFRILIKNKIYWFHIRGEVFLENDIPTTIIGTLDDCTLNKSILYELNNSLESNSMAMKAGNIGTFHAEMTNDEWIWNWDTLANEMFGLQPSDIGNLKKWFDKVHPEDSDRMKLAMTESLKTGKEFSENFRAILPDQNIRYFKGRGRVGQDSLGNHFRIDGICVDETAIYEAELKLKQSNLQLEERVLQRTNELLKSTERAEAASQIKTDFLSMMSHELRTPMNGVIGSLDLLTTTKQTDDSKDLIDTAKTSAENLVFILNDILDISKIEAGKFELDERVFSISEVIDNVIKVFIPVATKRNIILNVLEDPETPMFVKGDAMRVRQILFNLLGNALKFTSSTQKQQGRVTLKTNIIESNDVTSTISLKIIDNGIGINTETQQKLFMPFIQAERSTTRKYGGTGLGLAICGKLTEMMGGRIKLTSKEGEGSCFDVEIPFWKSQETRAMHIESLPNIKVALVSGDKAIDDMLDIYMHYLQHEGAEVSTCKLVDYSTTLPDFDVLFIFLNDEVDNQKLAYSILEVVNNSRITIAVKKDLIEKTRKNFKGVRVCCSEPITRIQLIQSIQHAWQSRFNINLDELDLSALELESDEDELSLDTLDFDFDSPDEHKNTTKEEVKADILLVEDNPLNQKLIVRQLSQLGYPCDLADDGLQGKIMWEEGNYQLLLTDCHMPNIDGYEMTRQIRATEKANKSKPIPIVAVTGAAMSGDAEYCYDAGMNDFVSKPIQLADLREMLKKWYVHDRR